MNASALQYGTLSMPKIIDLSMPITEHFRWKPTFNHTGDLAGGDQYQVTWIETSVHAFTHIDTPRHIMADGYTTDELMLEQIIGECAIVDLTGISPNTPIEVEALATAGKHIRPGDIALIKASWDQVHSPHTPEFWSNAPYMTREGSQWLLEQQIKAIAYDFPQDYPIRTFLTGETRPFEEHVTHDILLRNGVIMIEYLCNTVQLTGKRTFLMALPLKIANADGAPARVVALDLPSLQAGKAN